MIRSGEETSAVEYPHEAFARITVNTALERTFAGYDLIACPTLAVPAVPNGPTGYTIGPTSINGSASTRSSGGPDVPGQTSPATRASPSRPAWPAAGLTATCTAACAPTHRHSDDQGRPNWSVGPRWDEA